VLLQDSIVKDPIGITDDTCHVHYFIDECIAGIIAQPFGFFQQGDQSRFEVIDQRPDFCPLGVEVSFGISGNNGPFQTKDHFIRALLPTVMKNLTVGDLLQLSLSKFR